MISLTEKIKVAIISLLCVLIAFIPTINKYVSAAEEETDYKSMYEDLKSSYDSLTNDYSVLYNQYTIKIDSLNEWKGNYETYKTLCDEVENQIADVQDKINQVKPVSLTELAGSIVSYPAYWVKSAFNFDILGYNLAGVLFGIITLFLLVSVIRFLLQEVLE